MSELEMDARKDNEARGLAAQAVKLWFELGYTEEEVAEFISELYTEEEASA